MENQHRKTEFGNKWKYSKKGFSKVRNISTVRISKKCQHTVRRILKVNISTGKKDFSNKWKCSKNDLSNKYKYNSKKDFSGKYQYRTKSQAMERASSSRAMLRWREHRHTEMNNGKNDFLS
jgi:hypothetical protein